MIVVRGIIMKTTAIAVFAATFLIVASPLRAAVSLVESGHTLAQVVDSFAPLHPSQSQLESACSLGSQALIESIGTDRSTGTLYVQLGDGSFTSSTSCIFSVTPTGVVTLVNPSTGFGINSRGTDLHFDPATGLLVTLDQNNARMATVLPAAPGTTGTYSSFPGFTGVTMGMGFSTGPAGSDVPAGDVVFTADSSANGIYSGPFGGAHTTHLTPASGAGDDMVVQPDGDWVWIGDFVAGIINYSPVPPHTGTPSGFDIQTIFANAGLTFVFGSRGAVCPTTGDIYLSFSGAPGGTGIFRMNEALTTVTHVATITAPEGLQDLIVGVSSAGVGGSLYFTTQEPIPGAATADRVWEITLPECSLEVPRVIPAMSPLGLVVLILMLSGLAYRPLSRRIRRA